LKSQVGNGPRHFANVVMRPRTQPIVPHGLLQQALSSTMECAELADLAYAHGRVMGYCHASKTRPLTGTSCIDACTDRCRRFRRGSRSQVGIVHQRDFHMNINAVEQRTRNARSVALDLLRGADTGVLWIRGKSTRTPVQIAAQHYQFQLY
jgi:hypothetical protein